MASKILRPKHCSHNFINFNYISPTSHSNDLYLPDVLLIYNFAHDNNICLVHYLLAKYHTHPCISYKISVLIAKLCKNAGIQVRPTDKINKQLGIFNNSTFYQSLGQFQAITIERGDDDEKEGNEHVAIPSPQQMEHTSSVKISHKRILMEPSEGPLSHDPLMAKLEEMQ